MMDFKVSQIFIYFNKQEKVNKFILNK